MIGSYQRNLKENVPEQEVCQIKRAIATIFEFMNEIDNYTMLLGNSKDFLQYTNCLLYTSVDLDSEGNGTRDRYRKDSFYWYKKVIASNGEDLT